MNGKTAEGDEWGRFCLGNSGGPGRPRRKAPETPQRTNARDARGRFAKGNPGGPGKPAHRAQRFRKALEAARTQAEYDALFATLQAAVDAGESWAGRLWLQIAFGPP